MQRPPKGQLPDQGEIQIQRASQLQNQAFSLLDELATQLGKLGDFAGLWRIRLKGPQLLVMVEQKVQSELSVAGVILGSAHAECFSVLGQRGRIDWEQDQKWIALQCIDERTLGQF